MPTTRTTTTREITVREDEQTTPEIWRRFFVFDIHLIDHLGRLWENRYLIHALTVRGIRARYKQSLIGVGWALLTPLAMTIVCAYMYGALGISDRKGATFPCPTPIYLLFTLAFWSFFTRAVTNGSTSLVTNMDLVTKVYFPREVLPIASVLTNLVDLALAFLMWAIFAACYSFFGPDPGPLHQAAYPYYPHAGWLWLPVLLAAHLLLILGIIFIASTMQVYFRDIGHLIGLGMLLWLIITPVLYPLGAFSGGRYTMLMNLNPMTGIIDGYRLAIISRQSPWVTDGNWEHHVIGAVIFAVFIFMTGYSFFKHEERYFADVV
jgi:homopolymeric O-antigen transport system permease protein